MKRELTEEDVLPLELNDGTRITCDSIAGGADSTNGVPNRLHLCITTPTGYRRYQYTSCLFEDKNPWPRFEPHPDDASRCYRCGTKQADHGSEIDHCPPAIVEPQNLTPADEDALDERVTYGRCIALLEEISTIVRGRLGIFHDLPLLVQHLKNRADVHSPEDLPGRASTLLSKYVEVLCAGADQKPDEVDGETLQVLAAYLVAHRLEQVGQKLTTSSMLQTLTTFIGSGFGSAFRASAGASADSTSTPADAPPAPPGSPGGRPRTPRRRSRRT